MATNPRIPPEETEHKQPQLVPNVDRLKPRRPGSGAPGMLIAILVAAVLLGVVLYFMPRNPKQAPSAAGAQVPAQPVPGELQLGAMQLVAAPTGNSFYLDGRITNTGPHEITGILAEVKLRGQQNEVVEDGIHPLEGMKTQGNDLVPDAFANDPMKPGQTRSFRLHVDQVPTSWNNNLPEVRITTVTAAGAGK